VFSKLKELETLFLYQNKIIFLPGKLFENNQKLKSLNLSENQLLVVASLYPSESWSKLGSLNFKENPCTLKNYNETNVVTKLNSLNSNCKMDSETQMSILGKTLSHVYQKLNEESERTMRNTEDIQILNQRVILMESSKLCSDKVNELESAVESLLETVTDLKCRITIIMIVIVVVILDVIVALCYLIKQLK
jgi:Leucine-rich repeat (LRR) protein